MIGNKTGNYESPSLMKIIIFKIKQRITTQEQLNNFKLQIPQDLYESMLQISGDLNNFQFF